MQSVAGDLREQVYRAAGRAEVRDAVARIYAELQYAMDARGPRCDASGRCCHFEQFGHRLFVTTLELAAFIYDLETGPWPSACGRGACSSGCPFQIESLCGVHPIRPFGCRIFFCDASSTDWQQEQYERFHSRLKRLHDDLGVPYYYVEWRQALAVIL